LAVPEIRDSRQQEGFAMKLHEVQMISSDDAVIEPALSWNCAFCVNLRVEGGRPFDFGHLDMCPTCRSRAATTPKDRAAVAATIDEHLL
jgi:hypothetical protein